MLSADKSEDAFITKNLFTPIFGENIPIDSGTSSQSKLSAFRAALTS